MSKQTQTQQTISNEEIEKKINFLNSKDLPTVWKLKELSKWMQDNLQAQTNESELIEDIENILYKHIKSICKINSIIDDITQFRNHQNTKQESVTNESELIELLKSLDEPISADDNDCCHIKIYCDEWNKIKELIK